MLTKEEVDIINSYLDKKIGLIKELNIKEILNVYYNNNFVIAISCIGHCSKSNVRRYIEEKDWLSIYDILTEDYTQVLMNSFNGTGDYVVLNFILNENSIKQILRNTNLKELI